jgi:NitT/TauT family transport system substrate-binding protein
MKSSLISRALTIWEGLPPNDRRALTIVVVFLTVVFGYVFLVEPILFRYDAAKAALVDLAEQEGRYTRQVSMLARREAKLTEHRAALSALQNHFRLQTVSPELTVSRSIVELSYYARLANVNVNAVRPMEIQGGERYVELPLEAEVTGTFDALQRFFYYVDTSPSLIAITDLDLKSEDRGPLQVRLKLSAIARGAKSEVPVSAARTPPHNRLQLVLSHWTGGAPLIVAKAQGYLDSEEFGVDLLPLDDSVTTERLMLSGEVDGIVLGLPEVLNLWVKGLPLKAVLPIDSSAGSEGIVVSQAVDVKSLADLRGREIAVDPQGTLQFVLMKALQGAHLSIADVKLRPLDPGQVARELVGGTVEVGMTREPHYSTLLSNDQGRSLYSSEPLDGLIYDFLALAPDALANKRKAVQFLVTAVLKGQQFIRDQPEQAVELMAHWQEQSDATTLAGFRKLKFLDRSAVADFFREQRFAKLLSEMEAAYETLQQPFPLVTDRDLFDMEFMKEAGQP